MNYDNLNKMISYIEEHLEENIDMKNLSKIVGTNDFILQRIFVFLTDITLNEYIKRRRLSRAFEELKNNSLKIIDVAIKYQYNSSEAFTRAFKNMFGITPSECRISKKHYKMFPIMYFKNSNQINSNLDYEIETLEDKKLFCFHISSDDESHLLYKIRKLYSEIRANGYYQLFNQNGMYGIYLKENNTYHYYIGSEKFDEKLEEYVISSGKYALFKLHSREQKDIVDLEKNIYLQWFDSTNFSIGPNYSFELYNKNDCYIYISIQ